MLQKYSRNIEEDIEDWPLYDDQLAGLQMFSDEEIIEQVYGDPEKAVSSD